MADVAAAGHGRASLQTGSESAAATIGSGQLHLAWHPLEPRVLGLVRLPRLRVSFGFSRLTQEERFVFMKRFDLYTQRGGG